MSRIQKHKPIILLSFTAFIFSLLLISTGYSEQLPSAPANVRAFDTPDDGGNSITVEWDGSGESDVISYTILRASVAIGDMKIIETIQADSRQYKYVDNKVERGNGYYYVIQARDGAGNTANSPIAGPVIPAAQMVQEVAASHCLEYYHLFWDSDILDLPCQVWQATLHSENIRPGGHRRSHRKGYRDGKVRPLHLWHS